MTPQKLPDGRWRVRVAVTVGGKQTRRQFTADRRTDVIRAATEWIQDQSRPKSGMTVGEACRRYINAKASVLSPATVRTLNSDMDNHFNGIDIPLDSFDNLAAQEWIAGLVNAGMRPSTVATKWSELRSVLSFYQPDRSYRVRLPKRERSDIYVPDDTMMRAVFEAVRGTDVEIAVALAATIPARASEVLALRCSDFNGRVVSITRAAVLGPDGVTVIKAPKTEAGIRTVKIPESVARMIDHDPLVPYASPNRVTEAFQRVLRKAGLPRMRFHALRHYGASVMLSMGIPFKEVQRRGGWESAKVLQDIYAHSLADQIPVADQRIGAHFDSLIK